MKTLPMYPSQPQAAIARSSPLARNAFCTLCALHESVRTVCIPAEGKPGGLLVVSETPGKIEDQSGRGYLGASGKYVRTLVEKFWSGPIAFDHAVRCHAAAPTDKHIDACRPYGAQLLREVNPSRIVCFGNAAVESVLGHRPPLLSAQRGYGFLFNLLDDPVPVFFMPNPVFALKNRMFKAEFERDVKWLLTCDAPEPSFDASTHLVTNEAEAHSAVYALRQSEWFAYDVETTGKMGNADFRLEALTAMGVGEPDSWTWTREALRDPKACAPLSALLADPAIGKTTQNGKYDDRAVLSYLRAHVAGTRFDTRLGRKLLEPEADARLDTLAYLVGLGGHKAEAEEALSGICKELRRQAFPLAPLTPKGKPRKVRDAEFDVDASVLRQIQEGADAMAFAFGYLDAPTLYRYNARDVLATRQDAILLEGQLAEKPQIERVWKRLTSKANTAIRYMEHWGIACDRSATETFSIYCEGKITEAQRLIDKHAPGLNPNSPKQVGEFLFDKLKLRSIKQTDSGANSTDNSVLEALAHKHPMIAALVQNRKYSKLNGTYARGMLPHIRDDGRVHPSILIDGARTGRFSCADPNLQNIPRSEGGPNDVDAAMARNCFIAAPGCVLIELDYSQIELRVAAMLSGDEAMIDDYRKGIDIHMKNATACCTVVWGIPRLTWDSMSKDERKPYRTKIKTATFGKLYGKTEGALAREWGVSRDEVEKINSTIWGRYKRLAKWCEEQIQQVRRVGYVESWWDGEPALRRPLHKIADPDEAIRKHAENEAVNTPVQGTAANFMTASIPMIVDWILEESVPAKVVLTVHDSVMLEVRERYLDEVAERVRQIMCGHNSNGVVIDVEAKYGAAWGVMKDYKFRES